jgi:hypothetical membrane protein
MTTYSISTGFAALFLIPVVYFAVMIVAAHIRAPEGYRWTQNTISDLGCQKYERNWIMRAGFIGFGLLLVGLLGVKSLMANQVTLADGLIAVYGFSVLLTGFFCAAPWMQGVKGKKGEAQLHSFFATLAGWAMMGAIVAAFTQARTVNGQWVQVAFFFLILACSGLFGLAENGILPIGKGVAQRALYVVGLLWILVSQGVIVIIIR